MAESRNRLGGIESLRAYASIAIILFHLVGSGGVPLPESIGFIGSHFGQGVPLFFAVSGFGLSFGYFDRLNDAQQIKHYFMRRFTRIAPLFYVALVFQLFYLWLDYGLTFTPVEVLLNATFAFNIIPHLTDGVVPASWTIGIEMIFYAMFPLIVMLCTNAYRTLLVVALSIVIGTHFTTDLVDTVATHPSFVYHNFISNLSHFMFGVLSFHAFVGVRSSAPKRVSRYLGWTVCTVAIVLMIVLYKWMWLYMFLVSHDLRPTFDALWGIPFGMLCVGIAIHPTRLLSNVITQYLGKISFSVYLVHANIVYKLGEVGFYKWIYVVFGAHVLSAYAVCAIITIIIVAAIASITFRWIEQPGMNLGKRITSGSMKVANQE